jgi:RimJ/RimL family protein N-acetyltransferase
VLNPVLIDLPAPIETERLIMRPPTAGDGPMLHSAIAESLPELRRFLASLPWVAADQSVESSEAYCRTAHANFIARKDLPFLLVEKVTGQLVGAAGFHRIEWTTPKLEVGYWGRVSRAGSGFISEAVDALTAIAFSLLGVARVELIIDEENHASRRVAERCHFTLEGILRSERRAPDGNLRNTCVYARFPPTPQPFAATDSPRLSSSASASG